MSYSPGQINTGAIRPDVDPNNQPSDVLAEKERKGFRNHSLEDAKDNYEIRKAFKSEFIGHSCLMFRIILVFVTALAVGILALIVDYIWCIWTQVDKVESILYHLFTHSLALVAGLLLKAVFGAKQED